MLAQKGSGALQSTLAPSELRVNFELRPALSDGGPLGERAQVTVADGDIGDPFCWARQFTSAEAFVPGAPARDRSPHLFPASEPLFFPPISVVCVHFFFLRAPAFFMGFRSPLARH